MLSACTQSASKEALAPLPTPSPSPSPSPTPTIAPVAGAIEIDVARSGRPERLGFKQLGPTADGSVRAAADAVGGVLDTFLDGAQRGQPDLATIGGKWLDNADPAAAETMRSGLTNGDNPVEAVTYAMEVQVEPNPTLVAVRAAVTRWDATVVTLELVFDVTGERPLLHLVGAPEAA